MTVVNVHVSEQAINILSDTLVYNGEKPVALCKTKCDVIGDRIAAIACRGQVKIARMHRELFSDVAKFDDYVGNLHLILAEYEASGVINEDGHEITIAGYSAARQRLVAVQGVVAPETRQVTVNELGAGWHLSPALGTGIMARVPTGYTDDLAQRLTLAQWKLSQTAGWNFCIGGVMTLTSVTSTTIAQRIGSFYPDYERHRELFGDPNEAFAADISSQKVAA